MLPSDPDKSYDYLMRCARAVIERNRLHWYRDELSRSIGGGWVNPVGKGKGKSSEKATKGYKKGKSAGKGGSGAHKAARNSSRERSPSPDGEKGSENDRPSSPRKRDKDLCRAHLTGKCKAGENCVKVHNPPCRFFQRGMCTKGKDCPYPHRQRTLAGVAENSESSDDSGDENKSKSRGKSRERTGK
jgi:hypothetical protein